MSISDWRVLVVDDEYDSAEIVGLIFEPYGSEIFITKNGIDCLNALERVQPTLIVVDLAMPKMDGWQTLVEIRALPQYDHVPVVAITAYHSSKVADDARQAGFDAYFQKPIDVDRFMDGIKKLFN